MTVVPASVRRQAQIALTNALLSVPPFRSARFKLWYLTRRRERARQRRRRAEAAGSDALSRPALHRMDERVLSLLGPGGYFVEAGANDGFEQSNTYWLERFHGWRGVLVEAIPEVCVEAIRERPAAHVVNCVLVADDHATPTVTMHAAGVMSIVAGARGSAEEDQRWVRAGTRLKWGTPYMVEVPARTLTAVLDDARAPRPDLISLDVEGFEAQVLRGLDLDRYGPQLLLVEAHDDSAREAIEAVLGARYVLAERLSATDLLYRSTAE